jgi:hypothetical protein
MRMWRGGKPGNRPHVTPDLPGALFSVCSLQNCERCSCGSGAARLCKPVTAACMGETAAEKNDLRRKRARREEKGWGRLWEIITPSNLWVRTKHHM